MRRVGHKVPLPTVTDGEPQSWGLNPGRLASGPTLWVWAPFLRFWEAARVPTPCPSPTDPQGGRQGDSAPDPVSLPSCLYHLQLEREAPALNHPLVSAQSCLRWAEPLAASQAASEEAPAWGLPAQPNPERGRGFAGPGRDAPPAQLLAPL